MNQKAKTLAAVGTMAVVCVVALAIAISSDSRATGADGSPIATKLISPHAAVIDAWQDVGLTAGGFAQVEVPTLADAQCERGAVSGIEVLVCQYPSIDDASAASAAAESLIGDATGAVLSSGPMVVVASDRMQVDPSGKRLNLLLNTFRTSLAGSTI